MTKERVGGTRSVVVRGMAAVADEVVAAWGRGAWKAQAYKSDGTPVQAAEVEPYFRV